MRTGRYDLWHERLGRRQRIGTLLPMPVAVRAALRHWPADDPAAIVDAAIESLRVGERLVRGDLRVERVQ